LSDSGFQGFLAPLVFVRTVGISAADALRLMQAAQRMSELVRWRLAPPGVHADVYLAHANSVCRSKPPAPQQQHKPGNSSAGQSQNSSFDQTQLYIDDNGWHKTHPVCVLGHASAADDDFLARTPSLAFPEALQMLQAGLHRIEGELIALRMLYILGCSAWEERARWKTHRLQLSHNARLVAVIEPMVWRAHLLGDCTVDELGQASLQAIPHSSNFAAPGFDALPLEGALWEFAKRCPEGLLSEMVPTVYLRAPLTHRRPTKMSARFLGEHCVAILRALDTHSRTADELQTAMRMQRPALLRTLACLALIRAIHPEPRPRGLLGWLPQRWRGKVFGISGLF
jgi:hypothetical protein